MMIENDCTIRSEDKTKVIEINRINGSFVVNIFGEDLYVFIDKEGVLIGHADQQMKRKELGIVRVGYDKKITKY